MLQTQNYKIDINQINYIVSHFNIKDAKIVNSRSNVYTAVHKQRSWQSALTKRFTKQQKTHCKVFVS